MNFSRLSIASLLLILMSSANLSSANKMIEIDFDTSAFDQRKIISGDLEVLVGYQPSNGRSYDAKLNYQINYQNQTYVEATTTTFNYGRVFLQDLDNNGIDEVIISTYSGGAHCCTNYIIYSWSNNQFVSSETGPLNAGGGVFEDLDNDGIIEFSSDDNAFLYTFSSYAGSFPPSSIYQLQQGKLADVTRNYPEQLQLRAAKMYEAFTEAKANNYEVNGILASLVAQKILLGDYQAAWQFMLAHYDRESDWGLNNYGNNDNSTQQYSDFPTALKAFLIETGYLNQDGTPVIEIEHQN